MAAALPAIQIATTVISAIGALSQASAASDSAKYNAKVADQNAAAARQQGEAAAQAQDRAARKQIGAMSANYGASGVSSDAGSPLDILEESARTAALDNLTTKYNYGMKATGYQNQSTLDSSRAHSATTSGYLNALGAVGKGASNYFAGSGNTIDWSGGDVIPMQPGGGY